MLAKLQSELKEITPEVVSTSGGDCVEEEDEDAEYAPTGFGLTTGWIGNGWLHFVYLWALPATFVPISAMAVVSVLMGPKKKKKKKEEE